MRVSAVFILLANPGSAMRAAMRLATAGFRANLVGREAFLELQLARSFSNWRESS